MRRQGAECLLLQNMLRPPQTCETSSAGQENMGCDEDSKEKDNTNSMMMTKEGVPDSA